MNYFLFSLVILFASCAKEKSCEACNTEQGFVDAQVLYTGPVATDGCDWVVKVGTDQYYHPDSLDDDFKENELHVKVCFTLTSDKYHCGIAGTGMTVIHILDMRK